MCLAKPVQHDAITPCLAIGCNDFAVHGSIVGIGPHCCNATAKRICWYMVPLLFRQMLTC
jgi:hypothetical protein